MQRRGEARHLGAEMRQRLQPLVQRACPFARRPATNAPVQWVTPRLVCEVAFQEWTEEGIMRQPIFLGLREDKPATSVHREEARALEQIEPVRIAGGGSRKRTTALQNASPKLPVVDAAVSVLPLLVAAVGVRLTTATSASESATARFIPLAPVGGTICAASPARNSRLYCIGSATKLRIGVTPF